MVTFGLVGAGGMAPDVLNYAIPSLNAALPLGRLHPRKIVYVESEPKQRELNGVPIISINDFLNLKGRRLFALTLAASDARERLAGQLITGGAEPLSITHKTADVNASSIIGEGALIGYHAMVAANSVIGRFFQAVGMSTIGHDNIVGDYVRLAPRAFCSGHVEIGNHVLIGAGALIRKGTRERPLKIGDGATVGMGAVVTKDVEPGTTVVGNPAKPVVR